MESLVGMAILIALIAGIVMIVSAVHERSITHSEARAQIGIARIAIGSVLLGSVGLCFLGYMMMVLLFETPLTALWQ